jgi:heat shock protein HslJ
MTRIPLISAAIAATLGLAACEPTTSSTPGANIPTGPYVLVGIGSDTVPQRNVGMTIEADGSISGQGPCNNYSAKHLEALQGANGITFEGGVLTVQGPTYLTYEPGYRKEK